MENTNFSFENLAVWQKAVEFACKVIRLTENIETDRKHYRIIENCEASATSIASNIAEGNGRYSTKEYIHFLYIARGSLYESITQLIIFHRSKWISEEDLREQKLMATEIGKMISALIKSLKKSI
jgi:four helix bundle protein